MRVALASLFFIFSACSVLHPQTLNLSVKEVQIRQAQGGPIVPRKALNITAAGEPVEWTATASTRDGEPWIQLSAASGKTPASIKVGIVDWRVEGQKAGHYTGTVKFTANGASETLKVDWTVVAAAQPKFTYLAGPAGCETPAGYPEAAQCSPLNESPLGKFVSPAAGAAYTDPNFGGNVRVVTEARVHHTYATPNPLSANNTYLMTFLPNGSFDVLVAATGKPAARGVEADQNFFWDADNDDLYYAIEGASIYSHDVKRKKRTKVMDYGKAPYKFTAITRGGTGDSSKDNWISFFAVNERKICALDIAGVKTYCADYSKVSGPPFGKIDYSLITKGVDKTSGKRYVVLIPANETPGFYSVNPQTGALDFEFRGPEDVERNGNQDGVCDPGEKCMLPSHSDTMEDSAGNQYLVYNKATEVPCEVSLSTYQINAGARMMEPSVVGGGRTKVMSLWKCPYPNSPGADDHVACAKKAPYCVVSTVAPVRSVNEPPQKFPHNSEIILIRENGAEIRRLAQNRSAPYREEGDERYWSQPHASISNDGSLIVFDSNFGAALQQRVNILQTGVTKP